MIQLDVARQRPFLSLADDHARLFRIHRKATPSGGRGKGMCAQARRGIQRAGRCDKSVLILYLEIRQPMKRTPTYIVELAPLLFSLTCHVEPIPHPLHSW